MKLRPPPIVEIVRTDVSSEDAAINSLKLFYEPDGGHFNYLTAFKSSIAAYKGLHELRPLLASCAADKNRLARLPNRAVLLAAPVAFGRVTQVFDLTDRRFPFGRDRYATYRVPFFFVENGIVKVYFLQPRKSPYLGYDDVCGLGTILKRYLLDQEFYGHAADVEIVNVGSEEEKGPRLLRVYTLADLELWTEERLSKHLRMVSRALDRIEEENLVDPTKRIRPLRDPDLPLFD